MGILLTIIVMIGMESGIGFTGSLGLEPALLLRGHDIEYSYRFRDFIDFPSDAIYASGTFRAKAGLSIAGTLLLKATGGVEHARIVDAEPLLYFPFDTTREYYPSTALKSLTWSMGGEVGLMLHSLSASYQKKAGDIFAGLEYTRGRFKGNDSWHTWEDDQFVALGDFSYENPVEGIQGYVGISVPFWERGPFSFTFSGLLRGGSVRELYITPLSLILRGAEMHSPRTLLKWGASVGLGVAFNGGG